MTTETTKKPDTAGSLLEMAALYSAGWVAVQVLAPLVRLLIAG